MYNKKSTCRCLYVYTCVFIILAIKMFCGVFYKFFRQTHSLLDFADG